MSGARQIATLKKLLRSRDLDRILQGVELAAALDDITVWEQLLDGVTYETGTDRPALRRHKWSRPAPTVGRFVPGGIFDGNTNSMLWDELAIALLVARSRHPLRDAVTALSFSGGDYRSIMPIRLDGLDGFPRLETLELTDIQNDVDLTPLQSAPSLRDLRLDPYDARQGVFAVRDLPHLESLVVKHGELIDVSGTPELRSAELHCEVGERSGLRNLRRVVLGGTARLDFARDCPYVERFGARNIDGARAEVPPGAIAEGGSLHAAADDLGDVATLRELEYLRVWRAEDISSLARCHDLRILDLRSNGAVKDIAALEGHPNLRMIAVHGSGVLKAQVPRGMRSIVSFAKDPDLEKAARRPAPGTPGASKTGPKRSAETRQRVAKVRRLLTAPDAGSILQGVELVRTIDDQDLWEALLDGVTFVESAAPRMYSREPVDGALVPNKIFEGTASRSHWLDLALALLIAASRSPLRDQVTRLDLGQISSSKTPIDRYPIGGLASLPNLVELKLRLFEGSADLTPLDDAPSLRSLHLERGRELTVPSLKTVESLWSTRALAFAPDGSWPELADVSIDDPDDASELRPLEGGAPALRSLRISSVVDDEIRSDSLALLEMMGGRLGSGSRLPGLREATFEDCTIDGDVLGGATDLRRLSIRGTTSIRRIELPDGCAIDGPLDLGPDVEDLGRLGRLRGLRRLDLRGVTAPLSLETLRDARELRVLDVRNATGISDLQPLVGLPELRSIAIRGSGIEAIPPELRRIATRAASVDLDKAFDRPPPSQEVKLAAVPVPEEHRSEWERVVALLATSDPDRALEAARAAIDLGPVAVEHLLSKLSLEHDRLRQRRPWRLGDRLLVPGVAAALLVAAPADSVAAARLRRATSLLVEGERWSTGTLSLDGLAGLAGLRHLVIRKLDALSVDLAGNELESVTLRASSRVHVSSMPPGLRRLAISRANELVLPDLGASSVEELIFWETGEVDCADLEGIMNLRRLEFWFETGRVVNLRRLQALPLEHLVIPFEVDLTPLVGHPTLKRIDCPMRPWANLRSAARLPRDLQVRPEVVSFFEEADLDIVG